MKVFNLNSKLGLVFGALVTIANLTIAGSAFAEAGGDHSGGGNFSGLSAAAALKLVPQNLVAFGSDLVSADQLRAITNLATSDSTVVAMSPSPIPVAVAGIIQQSSAYTVSGKNSAIILVYQGDWDAHKSNMNEEIAFMTHEACVSLGIENTAKYGAVSAELLNRLNAKNPSGLSSVPISPWLSAVKSAYRDTFDNFYLSVVSADATGVTLELAQIYNANGELVNIQIQKCTFGVDPNTCAYSKSWGTSPVDNTPATRTITYTISSDEATITSSWQDSWACNGPQGTQTCTGPVNKDSAIYYVHN